MGADSGVLFSWFLLVNILKMKHDVYKYICFLLALSNALIAPKCKEIELTAAAVISAGLFFCTGLIVDVLKAKQK